MPSYTVNDGFHRSGKSQEWFGGWEESIWNYTTWRHNCLCPLILGKLFLKNLHFLKPQFLDWQIEAKNIYLEEVKY